MTDETQPSASPTYPLAVKPVKPGWQTSEFWFSFGAVLLSTAYASGLLTNSTALAIAGIASSALTALGYKVSRTLVKTNA